MRVCNGTGFNRDRMYDREKFSGSNEAQKLLCAPWSMAQLDADLVYKPHRYWIGEFGGKAMPQPELRQVV